MLKDYNCLRGQPQNYTAAEFDVFKNECAIWIKLMQLGGEWEFFLRAHIQCGHARRDLRQ